MFKQTILAVLLISLALVSSTIAATPASFNVLGNLFERNVKRSTASDDLCCLPPVLSVKGTFNQASVSNNTLQTAVGGFTFYGDYKVGKIRQDIFYTVDGTAQSYSNWYFKISETLTVSYSVQDGKCNCYKTNPQQWNPLCVPTGTGKITKATIGAYAANKVEISEHGATGLAWTFREPQMAIDKCWILSSYVVMSTASQEQVYYDMVEKVDSAAFHVPSQCPSIEKCLTQ